MVFLIQEKSLKEGSDCLHRRRFSFSAGTFFLTRCNFTDFCSVSVIPLEEHPSREQRMKKRSQGLFYTSGASPYFFSSSLTLP